MAVDKDWLKKLNNRPKRVHTSQGWNPHSGTISGYVSSNDARLPSHSSSGNNGSGNSGGGSGGSSSGGSSESSGGDSSFDSAAYYAQLQAEAEERAREEAERLRREQERIAQNAYDRNMAALNDAYVQRGDLLKQNYDTTVGALGSSHDMSKGNMDNQANQALREAYINRMMSQRNLAQNMAAQGLSGGLAESTMAGLSNNYGNARNSIEETRANNLAELENTYQNNMASALQNYNNQLAEDSAQKTAYQMQLESDLANLIASSYTDMYNNIPALTEAYTAAMAELAANQAAYTPIEATVDNVVNPLTTDNAADYTGYNNYAAWARRVKANGYSDDQIADMLVRNGVSNVGALQYILNQL